MSAIIIHALKGMFRQFGDLPQLLKKSYSDFFVWIIAFVATVALGVDIGLVVGILVNLFLLLKWALTPKLVTLAETDFQDLNVDPNSFHDVS